MLPGNSFMYFLHTLGRIALRWCRNGKYFQRRTNTELSPSTAGWNHLAFFLGLAHAPVRKTRLL